MSCINPTVLVPQFNMRLCGLLLTLSVVLAGEYDGGICELCEGDVNVIQTKNNETHVNSGLSTIECFIYNTNLLRCNWRTDSFPEGAQYSASVQYCDEIDTSDHALNCSSENSKKLVECQGQIQLCEDRNGVFVKVNISINDDWYIICQYYTPVDIEKLDPPQNITTSIKSTNLEIQWELPKSCFFKQRKCFMYELKINNEPVDLKYRYVQEYNITNFDPTSSYTVQIRTKPHNDCASNNLWSDWSEAAVAAPSENVYHLNASVIASIAFVLPMILLAFLLVCKFQRLSEKLFPSIPNPSKNVQMLLERNDFNQVTPPKQSEEWVESLEVKE